MSAFKSLVWKTTPKSETVSGGSLRSSPRWYVITACDMENWSIWLQSGVYCSRPGYLDTLLVEAGLFVLEEYARSSRFISLITEMCLSTLFRKCTHAHQTQQGLRFVKRRTAILLWENAFSMQRFQIPMQAVLMISCGEWFRCRLRYPTKGNPFVFHPLWMRPSPRM